MRVWRLCRAAHAIDALSGDGGLKAAGRWHVRGLRIVYASATLSLAALELLVRVDRKLAPMDLVAVEAELPAALEIETLAVSKLKSGWRRVPAPASTQEIGSLWAASLRTAVLEVPSAVIPRERNYLLNPAQPSFRRIKIVGREAFSFDARLLT